MPGRMGLSDALKRLIATPDGRRAIRHLYLAATLDAPEEKKQRRNHTRIAVRLARKALSGEPTAARAYEAASGPPTASSSPSGFRAPSAGTSRA